MMIISPRCLCASATAHMISLNGPRFGARKLYGCSNCGLVQLFPWPANGEINEDFYQNAEYLSKITRDEYFGYYKAFEEYLRYRNNITKDFRIIDFGAGHCWYQRFFIDEGYNEVHSVEINRYLLQHGRDILNLDNIHSDTNKLPQGYFDLIISNQVFEHLPDPIFTLRQTIIPLLKTGGLICFSVPNWDSWNRPVLRKRWLGYSPEDHLWFFSRRSLVALMKLVPEIELVDITVHSAVGKSYDGFCPKGMIKRMYYFSLWRLFENIGRGDQLIVTLRKCLE